MRHPKPSKDSQVQHQDLHKAGLKATAPRLKVLHLLEASPERHLTAEDVYSRLIESGELVGLATVYRVLAQFADAGLVNRHNFESGRAIFELNQGGHHDHMVCLETGKVIEFVSSDIEDLQRRIAESNGYELVDHSFVLYVRPKKK